LFTDALLRLLPRPRRKKRLRPASRRKISPDSFTRRHAHFHPILYFQILTRKTCSLKSSPRKKQMPSPSPPPTLKSLVPTAPRYNGLLKEHLKPVNPKTNTCWFWATPNKDCRFTADECRDLHAHLPSRLTLRASEWGNRHGALSLTLFLQLPLTQSSTNPARRRRRVGTGLMMASASFRLRPASTCMGIPRPAERRNRRRRDKRRVLIRVD
jgi:hypothetical protein